MQGQPITCCSRGETYGKRACFERVGTWFVVLLRRYQFDSKLVVYSDFSDENYRVDVYYLVAIVFQCAARFWLADKHWIMRLVAISVLIV